MRAQVPRDRLGLQEVGQHRPVGLVAVLQPEQGEHRRTGVGVVRPGGARSSQILDTRPCQAEPGAADVLGRVAVAPREVVVDASGGRGRWTVRVEDREKVIGVCEVREVRRSSRVGVHHVQRFLADRVSDEEHHRRGG